MPCFEERLEKLRNIVEKNTLHCCNKQIGQKFVIFVAKLNRYSEDFAQSWQQFLTGKLFKIATKLR